MQTSVLSRTNIRLAYKSTVRERRRREERSRSERERATKSRDERRKSRVDLYRLQKIEFNLHNVGAKTNCSWGVRDVSFDSRLK